MPIYSEIRIYRIGLSNITSNSQTRHPKRSDGSLEDGTVLISEIRHCVQDDIPGKLL